ncbi:MAG: hypothetical protein IJA86_00490 [Clostridia bacterium]|nr:hypothetical protein [Clostridia bacterium]
MNELFLTCSVIAVAMYFVISAAVSLIQRKHSHHEIRLTPHLTWCVMTVFSAFAWFFPYFWQYFEASQGPLRIVKTTLSSLQNVIRLFAVDESYADIMEEVSTLDLSDAVFQFYSLIGVILYLLAPILTFGFILALFKNLHAYVRYYTSFGKEVHIFSELNERSFALANSIVKEGNVKKKGFSFFRKSPLIIFADILDKNEEEHLDLVADAKEIGALLFRQDITAIRFKRSKQKMSFYLISDDETEKIAHMEHIIDRYRNIPNTELFIFSDEEESKCFLDSYPYAEKENMCLKVVRVNDIRSLIYHNLDINGIRLFERSHVCPSHEDPNRQEREIHAVIVGFGKYGTELTKALLWYCQVPGYRVKMTVFDENEETQDRFKAMCPEIQVGTPYTLKNDMRYEIRFEHCKVGTASFYKKLGALSEITYIFVSLGQDNLNIATSMGIRNNLAKLRRYPAIETVIYHSAIKERIGRDWSCEIKDPTNKSYQEIYDIHIIGDLENFYSAGTVIASDLILAGLSVHYRYCDITSADAIEKKESAQRTFYMDDYGFFSSVAKALHANLRRKIAERLNANDPQAKELFSAFVPKTAKDGKEIRDNLYWNRFILENTIDTEKAANLNAAMEEYKKGLEKTGLSLYPYKITPEEFKTLEKYQLSCSYEGEEFSSSEVIEIAKSAADIEHIRWNAYMRAEGYSFIADFKKKYDQKMKMHKNLTPCEELDFDDSIKDI